MDGSELPANAGQWAYFNGAVVPTAEAKISVMTHGFQYGTACLGGLRAYWNEKTEKLYLFRPLEHYRRLKNSAKALMMKLALSEAELTEITCELIRKNGFKGNVYVRPFLYKSDLTLGPKLHDVGDGFTIYCLSLNNYMDIDNGLKTMVSSWTRITENSIPTRAKASAGYLNSALAKSEALMAGLDEAIFLNKDGKVAEGSAENVFIVKNGKIITPSLDQDVLEGIVRKTVLEIASDIGIEVVERPVARTELYTADEIFFSGTGVQIAWVREVDKRIITEKIGPVATQIRDRFFKIVRGDDPKFLDWLEEI